MELFWENLSVLSSVLSELASWHCSCWVCGRITELSTLQLGPDRALAVRGSGKNSKVDEKRGRDHCKMGWGGCQLWERQAGRKQTQKDCNADRL